VVGRDSPVRNYPAISQHFYPQRSNSQYYRNSHIFARLARHRSTNPPPLTHFRQPQPAVAGLALVSYRLLFVCASDGACTYKGTRVGRADAPPRRTGSGHRDIHTEGCPSRAYVCSLSPNIRAVQIPNFLRAFCWCGDELAETRSRKSLSGE